MNKHTYLMEAYGKSFLRFRNMKIIIERCLYSFPEQYQLRSTITLLDTSINKEAYVSN
jgi:hypothetical protein